jgi:muramoyltetrapeptide carboxypeptidase
MSYGEPARAAGTGLVKGDAVAIVAPASQVRRVDVGLSAAAAELLGSWGLEVRMAVEDGHHFYLAGTDADRARHLTEMLLEPEIRAIFCARGGYGSARLLRHLDPRLRPSGKVLVGFSDVTALHAYFAEHYPNISLLHGPNVATRQLLDDTPAGEANRSYLYEALFDDYQVERQVEFLRGGSAEGDLFGGCLTILTSLVGTPYLPTLAGKLLFLEDVGEPPYRIDRMLTQLRDSGALAGVEGMVFSRMHECVDPYNDLREVIADVLAGAGIPIAFGLDSGHGRLHLPLPLGAPAELDPVAGAFRTVRTDSAGRP